MAAPGVVGDDCDRFMRQAGQLRGQLFAHCYRIMRSVDDAEDAVQETYLRAWRSFGGFEGRSSLRTWLFRIATNTCLTALPQRHRMLPTGLAEPDGDLAPTHRVEHRSPADPAEIVLLRDNLRLALMASLAYLTARQRVVLILRDVLDWPASEVAELLETTTDAVKSTLKRARARILEQAPIAEDLVEIAEPDRRALLARYLSAFQNADAAELRSILRHDALVAA
ncbi:MAG TPA: sigma-70 family RNA polymerase sigma factor [Pseudonocardiaceae bacterium]|nr:sigma-70 family RNA polymerase sigma factor [Pseudonocardiaceae bacterium]